MRFRLMATYRGVPYEAGLGPSSGDVVLFAACPPPEELSFEPATGHWRKQVIPAEVDALWESRPVGVFRGERCLVLDDFGDRLHIAYLGTDAGRATELGYWQVDRGVFELLTAREEVAHLTEERVDKPLGWGEPREGPAADPASPRATPPEPAAAVPGLLPDDGPGNGAAAPSPSDTQAPSLPTPSPSDTQAPSLPTPSPSDTQAPSLPTPSPSDTQASSPGARAAPTELAPETGRRSARRPQAATRDFFCELADRAAIPRDAYALEAETDGAMCMLATGRGFEVFLAADGARHEVRCFDDEEAAYFYLFGVLVAEAIRGGSLVAAPTTSEARDGTH